MNDIKEPYNSKDLARLYRVKETTITKWAREGRTEMKHAKRVGKQWLLNKIDVPAFLREKKK